MKRLRAVTCISAIAVCVGAPGCDQKAPSSREGAVVTKDIGGGTLTGNTYEHKFFGLSITFPDGWYISDQSERDELMEVGTDVVTGGDTGKKAQFAAARRRTLNLVTGFEKPPGTPGVFNNNIIILAERVKALPGIKRGADYLNLMKQSLAQSPMEYEFDEIEKDLTIGTAKFDCLPMRLAMSGAVVHQRVYAVRMSDYVLGITCSYGDDSGFEKIKAILDAVKVGN